MEETWIGFDLDGTLAKYDGFKGVQHIGEPIPKMVELAKKYLKDGYKVKILTARASVDDPAVYLEMEGAIKKWCQQHIGQELEVTCKKDFFMWKLYDDRCHRVECNTGVILA